MNRNPLKSEELESLEKSSEDPRLIGHKTQMWGSELAPHAITTSNVVSLVCNEILINKKKSILTMEILFATEKNVR